MITYLSARSLSGYATANGSEMRSAAGHTMSCIATAIPNREASNYVRNNECRQQWTPGDADGRGRADQSE